MNKTTTKSTILYADDDRDDQFFLQESITHSGIPASLVKLTDGEQVIHYMERLTEEEWPAIIVLDLNMPKKDGKQTLAYLKTHPRFAGIPVIILSTSENKNDKEHCTSSGAARYLVKPGHFSGYKDVVQSFIPYLQTRNQSANTKLTLL